jgi:hypothetical protein
LKLAPLVQRGEERISIPFPPEWLKSSIAKFAECHYCEGG